MVSIRRLLSGLGCAVLAAGAITVAAIAPAEAATPAPPPCTSAPYADVAMSNPFCADITWLKAQNITTGYADGGFHPDATITREAMAAFLNRGEVNGDFGFRGAA